MKGDRNDPFTQNVGNRGGKWCLCANCRMIARCTRTFDFYIRRFEATGELECERCMREGLVARGMSLNRLKPLEDS